MMLTCKTGSQHLSELNKSPVKIQYEVNFKFFVKQKQRTKKKTKTLFFACLPFYLN